MPYTTEQRNWLLKEYEKTNSADAVRVNWTAKYSTAAPSRKTIYRIRHKFDATGSVLNKKSTGRPKSVTTDENKELVAQAVADIPGISSRQASLELDISQTSVVRIMKSLKWKPYRPQLVQDLLAGDPDRRLEFCSNFLNEVEENPGGEAESERKLPWVFVGNLTEEISEQELRAMFSRFGEIIQIFFNLGFASVQMATQEGAARAVRHLDGYEVYEKKITVKLASDEKYVNINTSTTSIKIDNLSPMVTNERLKEALSIFGEVERAVVIVNHQGKSTTRGIVEFSSELAAQNAVKQIEENIFLVSTSPRPISARIMEQEDSIYGLSEEKIIKTTEYYEETMKAPRFAVAGSFEQQIGQTWKIRYQLERQQRDQVEENIARSRKIFEEQLITCFTKQQAAMKIKQEVLSYDEQRAVDQCKKELEATNQIGMQTQQLVETSQINTDESPSDLIILPPSTSHNNFNETNNQVTLITNPTTTGIGHKRSIESNHEDKEPHEKRRREMNEEEIGETSVPCETSSSVALWESQMVVNNNGQVVQSSRVTETSKQKEEKRRQIVEVYKNVGDWKGKAKELKVPLSTAYRWVSQGTEFKTKGGIIKTCIKVLDEHRDYMVTLVEGNPRITLAEICHALEAKFQLKISKNTAKNHLHGTCYTIRAIPFEPGQANTYENKTKRKLFVEKLLQLQNSNLPFVFMGETNFNLQISRCPGTSQVRERCTNVAAGSRGANIHLIGAINSQGWIHRDVKRGSFTRSDTIEFLKYCLRASIPRHGGPVVLLIDDDPCHSKVEESIMEDDDLRVCIILKLSPYSPMFNPIESVWAYVKSEVKRDLATKLTQVLTMATNANVSMNEHRLRALEELIHAAVQSVTPMLCTKYIADIQSKVAGALNLEDVQF